MEEKLRDSTRICRICGLENDSTESIFSNPLDPSLGQSLNFFLPVEVRIRCLRQPESKCDDQVTNKHPALEYLGAPPIEEGSIKLEAYLDRCERYVQKEWPILLEKYKEGTNDKADLEKGS